MSARVNLSINIIVIPLNTYSTHVSIEGIHRVLDSELRDALAQSIDREHKLSITHNSKDSIADLTLILYCPKEITDYDRVLLQAFDLNSPRVRIYESKTPLYPANTVHLRTSITREVVNYFTGILMFNHEKHNKTCVTQ